MTRIAYFNGKFVPETEVVIPYRDRSFNRGDGCFDMTRTFDGRIFRLAEHVERLYRSLRYLRIDIGLEPKEIVAISMRMFCHHDDSEYFIPHLTSSLLLQEGQASFAIESPLEIANDCRRR